MGGINAARALLAASLLLPIQTGHVQLPAGNPSPPADASALAMGLGARAEGDGIGVQATLEQRARPLAPTGGVGGVEAEESLAERFGSFALVPCFTSDPFNINVPECATQGAAALLSDSGEAAAEPVVLTSSDVARVLASGSGALRQPPGGQVLLSKPLIAYTDPSVRTLTATVGGVDVELSLTPVSYTWDWGDGTSTTTTDPGDVYPNQSVTHYYGQTASGVVVSVTTMWDAVFRPVGAAQWQPVVGQVMTTDEAAPFDIVRRVTVLTDTAEELQGH